MIRITLSSSVIIVLILNIICFTQTMNAKNIFQKGYDTRNLLLLSEQILSNIKDAETGYRGFIITHQSEFLQPYNTAKINIDSQLDRLQTLNTEKTDRLTKLTNKTTLFMTMLYKNIELVKNGKYEEVTKIENSGINKRIMDDIRIIISDMENDIVYQNIEQKEQLENSLNLSQYILIVNMVLVFGIILFVFWQLMNFEKKVLL